MKDAAATWALVIGIDAYDHVRQLTGAVHDAVDAVRWLRRLGVPDAQILLHAAPTPASQAALDALGLTYAGCRQPDFWQSFDALRQNSGPRLFVFLTGHGLYEPGGERVFLTQEADDQVTRNLGIDWYTRFLRGQNYTRQFVVMDGCLNLPYDASRRASFEAGKESGVALPPPRADVLQVFCFAAAQSQRAVEKDGHGLFLHHLLRALDLDDPNLRCLEVDEQRGVFQLDLVRGVRDVVAPTVTAEAAAEGRQQQPGMQVLSDGPTPSVITIAEITPAATARVRVEVHPGAAAPDLAQLMLWADNAAWMRRLPVPPAPVVQVPYDSVLPTGLHVAVHCTVRAHDRWVQPGLQTFVTETDRDVFIRLEPPTPAPQPESVVEVKTVGPLGQLVGGMTAAAYDHVEDVLGEAGANFKLERHETGPVLRGRPEQSDLIGRLGLRLARTINDYTEADVGVAVRGADLGELRAALTLPMTPDSVRELTGLLMYEDVITVGERRLSPAALLHEPSVPVDPGPIVVRVDLPWGEWVSRVVVDAGGTTRVSLPRSVGVPPLRVRLLGDEEWSDDPPRSVVAVGGPHEGRVIAGGEQVGELVVADVGSTAWRGPWSVATGDGGRWTAIATVPYRAGELHFPLSEHGALGLLLGAVPRAEPLSLTPSRHWDRLVSSGRLEELSRNEAEMLTYDKWSAPLLGLAGAYACYAQGRDDYLQIVLGNLEGLDADLPDLPVLRGAVDRRAERHDDVVHERLASLGRRSAMPVFRWGVALGVLAADHYGLSDLAAQLRRVDSRLVAGSTWTLWRAGRGGVT
jgi:hypothetical protein